jgi:hypothetical protein
MGLIAFARRRERDQIRLNAKSTATMESVFFFDSREAQLLRECVSILWLSSHFHNASDIKDYFRFTDAINSLIQKEREKRSAPEIEGICSSSDLPPVVFLRGAHSSRKHAEIRTWSADFRWLSVDNVGRLVLPRDSTVNFVEDLRPLYFERPRWA